MTSTTLLDLLTRWRVKGPRGRHVHCLLLTLTPRPRGRTGGRSLAPSQHQKELPASLVPLVCPLVLSEFSFRSCFWCFGLFPALPAALVLLRHTLTMLLETVVRSAVKNTLLLSFCYFTGGVHTQRSLLLMLGLLRTLSSV